MIRPLVMLVAFFPMVLFTVGFAAAQPPAHSKQTMPADEIKIDLLPQLPTSQVRMRWSPKGEKLKLTAADLGMTADLSLGPEGTNSIALRLEKSDGSDDYDRLRLDIDGNGFDASDRVASCMPTERNGSIWSSFDSNHTIVHASDNAAPSVDNLVNLRFWYVKRIDPDAEQEQVIRFNIQGWMQGSATIGHETVHLLLFDRSMNGVYETTDSWALAKADSTSELYTPKASRSANDFNWAGQAAFKVSRVASDGRAIWIEAFDPEVTREADELKRDPYAPDRIAKRAESPVVFLHHFDTAQKKAIADNLPMLLDFETTWCGPCKVMDRYVYTAEAVVKASVNVVSVKLDGDVEKELVEKYEVKGYPTLVLVTPEGQVIARASGYQSVKDVRRLMETKGQ